LTALRATGLISRNDNPFREDPAGPEVPVPGAQMLGPWRFGFALLPHAGSWDTVDAHRAADRFRLNASVVPGRAAADSPASTTAGLRVDGDGVVLSALRRAGDELELRLVAETPRATQAAVSLPGGIAAAREVDLLGRPGSPIPVPDDGTLDLALGAWEIRTIRVTRSTVAGRA
jgi:alpha-mannosidase